MFKYEAFIPSAIGDSEEEYVLDVTPKQEPESSLAMEEEPSHEWPEFIDELASGELLVDDTSNDYGETTTSKTKKMKQLQMKVGNKVVILTLEECD